MRGVVVAFCLVAATSAARAQSAPSTYPNEITERPLLLPASTNELGLTAFMPTYTLSTAQPDGTITTRRSGIGEYVNLSSSLRHSFGFIELAASVTVHAHHPSDRVYPSDVSSAGVSVRAGTEAYGDAVVSFISFPTGSSSSHARAVSAAYEYKWHAVPKRFALYAGGSIDVTDYTTMPPGSSSTTPAHSFAFSSSVDAELQLSPIVGIFVIGSIAVPIEDSSPIAQDRTIASTSAEVLVARGTYDLLAAFGIQDVSDGQHPFVDFGIRLRF